MPADATIGGPGPAQLRAAGIRLKAMGAGGLRLQLLRSIRAGAKPLIAEVREAARSELPRRGGLADRVASSPIAVRTRLTGTGAGVRIVNTAKGVQATEGGNGRRFGTDTGKLRHPVFGVWRPGMKPQQLAHSGWFSRTIEAHQGEMTKHVLEALAAVTTELGG